MSEDTNKKTDADYEAAYEKFLAARKSKKKKFPGWIILATSIAAVLVILLMLVKPWSAFEKEGESVDIYATQPYSEDQYQETTPELEAGTVGHAEEAIEILVEDGAPADVQAEAEAPQEGEQPQPESQAEQAPAMETSAQNIAPVMAYDDRTVQPAQTQAAQETAAQNAQADADTSGGSGDSASGMTVTGNIAQDNAGMMSPDEASNVAAVVETGELAFWGYDFFIVTNNGNDGMGNSGYATEYYKKLVNSKKASGNGIVIFVNGDDMTASIIPFGTAVNKLGSSGRAMLIEEFENVYRGGGTIADATNSVYYLAQDLLLAETDTDSDTSDGWTTIAD